jgi:hypothetical protein
MAVSVVGRSSRPKHHQERNNFSERDTVGECGATGWSAAISPALAQSAVEYDR